MRIFSFIEELYAIKFGNPIFDFETGADIVECLGEQWAGLFQRLLAQETSKTQASVLEELQRSLQTVDQMVKFLKQEKTEGAAAIDEILFSNHPLFAALAKLLSNKYRLYFTSVSELEQWLVSARSFFRMEEKNATEGTYEWAREQSLKSGEIEWQFLNVSKSLFSPDGALKPMTQAAWTDDYISFNKIREKKEPNEPKEGPGVPLNALLARPK